jgi:exopolyphosphatase/pppGpp-phosphohydrolase
MRRRRADLLPTGGLVLTTLAEVLDLEGYTLTDWGLREGVLLETVGAA